jgi:hypothetical protein
VSVPRVWGVSVLLLLSGCGGAELECDSLSTRNSIIKIVSDDNNNPLLNYAITNSNLVVGTVNNTKSEADKLAILERARRGAVYTLDDTIRIIKKPNTTISYLRWVVVGNRRGHDRAKRSRIQSGGDGGGKDVGFSQSVSLLSC